MTALVVLALAVAVPASAQEPSGDPPESQPPAEPEPGPDAEPEPDAEPAPGAEPDADAEPETDAATEPVAQGELTLEAPEAPAPPAMPDAPEPEPEPAPPAPTAPPPEQVPSPGAMEDRLNQALPETVRIADDWSAPTPVLTLHGYFRMRGELMDTLWLGRRELAVFMEDGQVDPDVQVGQGPDPFSRFRPLERRHAPGLTEFAMGQTRGIDRAPEGLRCAGEDTNSDGLCDVSTLRFANLRLRLNPQLNLSEDVRVKMTFDIFDNMIAGTAPTSYYGAVPGELGATGNILADTDLPPEDAGFSDSIKARRAWAEVRNRDLGELRFGRMPQQWGMGMLYNAGNRIDDDLSTDLDRLLGITKIFGLYLSASYDFIAEGVFDAEDPIRPLEQSQIDDVDQFTFSIARRRTPEETAADRERGGLLLDGGLQLAIRSQNAVYVPPDPPDERVTSLGALEADTYTWDFWGKLEYRFLRVEAELAYVSGTMNDVFDGDGQDDIDALGYALETEFRLLDRKLGLYLYHGLATGDGGVEGLSSDANLVDQIDDQDNDITTFRFHPSYRVDMILWRNIMRQVTGAYYFKPGISYDFIRSDFGQLFGARLDFIYSRASVPVQTWGNDANLGLEMNVSIYFQTEDGPDLDDGFHSLLQYGVLFPMRGLGYYHEDTDLDTAQNLRLLLGVKF
ncbi:MAG: TIGR04551 family protein [Myxococcales bacterium]